MEIISKETINHGRCLVDVYRQSGDLYDSWKIESVASGKIPDAGYGPDAVNRDPDPVEGDVVEKFVRWDENGWTYQRTEILVDGRLVASSGS